MYTLKEVISPADKRIFLDFPSSIYKGVKNWIRPLDKDVEDVFDTKKNKLFRTGKAIRWILEDESGKTVGRVAAFYDKKSAVKNEQPTGGLGFFECINDKEAAFMMFDACKSWLEQEGMEAMDGPVNFGDRNFFWGLLVEGDYPPTYGILYHHLYYKDFFESYGFENYYNQITYQRIISDEGLSQAMKDKAERVSKDPMYSFRTIEKNNAEKYAEYFMEVYNRAWAKFSGISPITKVHAMALLNGMKPFMDERLLWFGFYGEEPVSFFLMMPDINQIICRLNGKLGLWQKLYFWYMLRIRKSIKNVIGIVFGVVPEHRVKGLEGAIVVAFSKIAMRKDFQYKTMELNWIGDFNPAMMKVAEQVGTKPYKIHVTYRYLFDRNKPFKRAPKVNVG